MHRDHEEILRRVRAFSGDREELDDIVRLCRRAGVRGTDNYAFQDAREDAQRAWRWMVREVEALQDRVEKRVQVVDDRVYVQRDFSIEGPAFSVSLMRKGRNRKPLAILRGTNPAGVTDQHIDEAIARAEEELEQGSSSPFIRAPVVVDEEGSLQALWRPSGPQGIYPKTEGVPGHRGRHSRGAPDVRRGD